jgi:hypothetical protein
MERCKGVSLANEMVVRLRDMHPIVIRAQVRRPLSSRDISPPSRSLAAHATATKGLSAALWILEAGEKHVAGAVVAAGSRAFPNANTAAAAASTCSTGASARRCREPPVHGAVGSDATARQVRRLGPAVPTVPLGLASAAALASPRPLAACSSAQLGKSKVVGQNACTTKST